MRIGGYHDNDRCAFDLWSPVDDPNHCAVENRAFSPYAKHQQELMDAVDKILEQASMGNLNFTLEFDDDISDEDIEWIYAEVQRRL